MDSKGEVLLTIMASLAQQESESLSANVRMGIQFRNQQGKVQVNPNWFLGYTKDADGNLVIEPAQAEIVRRIYREYLGGASFLQIKRSLEAAGIPNGAGHKKWHESNIQQILTNEKYIGDALLQKTYTVSILDKKRSTNNGQRPKYYVEGSHEAIIDKDVFMGVQSEKGCVYEGAVGDCKTRQSQSRRQTESLQQQVRTLRHGILRTLRRHLPQSEVEQ